MSPRAIRISDLPASVRRKLDASERGPTGARTYPEHEMQSAFFRWVRSPEARAVYPGLDVCYAVPLQWSLAFVSEEATSWRATSARGCSSFNGASPS